MTFDEWLAQEDWVDCPYDTITFGRKAWEAAQAQFAEEFTVPKEKHYVAHLFSRAPSIGEVNPEGEISYVGYEPVAFYADAGTNTSEIVFPKSEQDEPVFASHVVALDANGTVVGVRLILPEVGE